MKAYCIVYEFIDNPEMFDQYRKQVMPTIEAHGGRFVVRGGKFTVLEGIHPANESHCWSSRRARRRRNVPFAGISEILPLRLDATRCSFVIADGVD